VLAIVFAAAFCPEGNGLFVLYYGDPMDARVVSAAPNFVVLGDGLEGRTDVPPHYHQSGIRAIAYLPTGYAQNDIDARIRTAMQSGFDGIFFDEVLDTAHAYNAARYALVKTFGASKLVIANPGTASVDPQLFDATDIVCVENQWDQTLSPAGMPAWRWLAVQGDPANIAADSAQTAESRLAMFRSGGGFWYYSAPYAQSGATHILLPDWLQTFATDVRGGAQPCPIETPDGGEMDAMADAPRDAPNAEVVVACPDSSGCQRPGPDCACNIGGRDVSGLGTLSVLLPLACLLRRRSPGRRLRARRPAARPLRI
jgi:Spherulation-specific family 4